MEGLCKEQYYRLVRNLRECGQSATENGDPDKNFELLLCGLKMTEAAEAFEKLLRWLDKLEDDGK